MFQFAARRPTSLRALVQIGGNEWLAHAVRAATAELQSLDLLDEEIWASLLSHPSLLDLRTKQLWLGHQLEQAVGAAGAAQLDLVATRGDLLAGLCQTLGVAEAAAPGRLAPGGAVTAAPLAVRFAGENAVGDGVRREWFSTVASELLHPDCGLFHSKDGVWTSRTLFLEPVVHRACPL